MYAPKLKYADQKHAPPSIGKGLFAWIGPVLKLKETDLADKIGMDATIFLRFTKMCRNMFLIIMVISVGVILPTNVITTHQGHFQASPGNKAKTFWTACTPAITGSTGLWVHVVCMWLVNGVVGFFLWRNYLGVTKLRKTYFQSQDYLMSLHARTLMFTNVPQAMRTDEGLLRLADEVQQTGGIPRAVIGRNVKELPKLIEQYEKAVRELEAVLAKYLKNPDKLPTTRPTMRPLRNTRRGTGSEKVDSIDYLTDLIKRLEIEIKHVRESIDRRNPMPYGFASFDQVEDAHSVALSAKKRKPPQGTSIQLAPRPHDLIWDNLSLSKKDRSWKRLVNNFWIIILTVIWVAPNALIAIFLSNLLNLANIWPAFNKNFTAHPTGWSIVQGIASPALTSLIYLILPIIFRRLSIHAGDRTKIEREEHVTSKLYAFFVFNNLAVFSIFATLVTFITTVISQSKKSDENVWDAIQKGDFFHQFLSGLIEVSPFWLAWLMQRNLGSAADIAQILNLFWTWFARQFLSPTPRQWIEWSAPPVMDYAVYYNYFLFYATVALCFTTVQPLVIPVTVFFFVIDYWLKKYLLLYVLITKNESGGQFWRLLFNRFIFATILADVVVALTLKPNGGYVHMAAMAPLPLLLLGFKFYCSRTFDDKIDFSIRSAKDPENTGTHGKKARHNDRVVKKFGHPALFKKLITPMVHAKAQSVMRDLYHGRLGDDNDFSSDAPMDYSDIAMDPMSVQHPGKSARFATDSGIKKEKDIFEVVPEAHLDFSYFKNRPDFREEFGEIYGRPTDLISERSGTPVSLMSHSRMGSGSPSSSRASSPGPGVPGGQQYRSYPSGQLYPSQNSSPSRTQSPSGAGANLRPSLPSSQQGSYNFGNGGEGRGHMYNNSNDSERNLLTGAQAPGYADDRYERSGGDGQQREVYGLDRWRTGGSGYVGVPGGEDEGGTGPGGGMDQGLGGYDAYRGRR